MDEKGDQGDMALTSQAEWETDQCPKHLYLDDHGLGLGKQMRTRPTVGGGSSRRELLTKFDGPNARTRCDVEDIADILVDGRHKKLALAIQRIYSMLEICGVLSEKEVFIICTYQQL